MLVHIQTRATKSFIDGVELSTLVGKNLPQRVYLCALTCSSLNLFIPKICKGAKRSRLPLKSRCNVSIPQQKECKEPPPNKTMFKLLQWLEVEVPSYTWRQAGTGTHTLQVFLYPSIKLHFEIKLRCEKNQQTKPTKLQPWPAETTAGNILYFRKCLFTAYLWRGRKY